MTRPTIERQIHALKNLTEPELSQFYEDIFDQVVPNQVPTELVERAIRSHLQQQLIAKLQSRLMQIVGAAEAILEASTDVRAEALLIRAWRGQTHVVTITDDGAIYRGQRYRTLDAVAHHITNGRRSGLELFGPRAGEGAPS